MKNGAVDQEFIESIKAHDPVDENGLRDWAGSDAGRQVLSEIVARRDGESRRVALRSRRFRALALAAGALAVVVAVSVGLILGVGGGKHEVVDRLSALESVVTMAEALWGPANEERPPDAVAPGRIAQSAESLGIITSAERESAISSGPVSRGMYALWVWRGLGSLLAPVRETTLTDLDGLSDEMRAAVLGVVAAGILDARTDGGFAADEPLTPQEELEARTRLETVVGLASAESADRVSP
jgi:hypothetical protein